MKTKKAKRDKKSLPIIADKTDVVVKDEQAYEIFKIWKIIPKTLLRTDEITLEKLGIDSEELQELRGITTQKAFAEKYDKDETTLARWNKKIENDKSFRQTADWFAKATPSVFLSLLKATRLPNNSSDRKLWFQVVNEWREVSGVAVLGKIEHTISEEDKKALDKLLKENAH